MVQHDTSNSLIELLIFHSIVYYARTYSSYRYSKNAFPVPDIAGFHTFYTVFYMSSIYNLISLNSDKY